MALNSIQNCAKQYFNDLESIMKNISKKIRLITFAALFTSFLSTNTYASFISNDDGANLSQCRNLVRGQFGEFERVKTRNIKSKARSFSVNFKVMNNNKKSVIQCKLKKNDEASINCLKGNICSKETTVSTEQ